MQLSFDKRFQKKLKGRIEKYAFEVGVLQDGPHKEPKKGQRGLGGRDVQTMYAGGPARKKSSQNSGMSIAEVSEENRKRLGFNYLLKPFKNHGSEILKFTEQFLRLVTGSGSKRRVVNLLQAIVRNPILRGEYGTNSPVTRKIKGFDRSMIDTAQLFKSIKARIIRNV